MSPQRNRIGSGAAGIGSVGSSAAVSVLSGITMFGAVELGDGSTGVVEEFLTVVCWLAVRHLCRLNPLSVNSRLHSPHLIFRTFLLGIGEGLVTIYS